MRGVEKKDAFLYFMESWKKNGRLFKLYKLRSMRIGSDNELSSLLEYNEADGSVFKMRNDPCITRVGKLIRKYSLDGLLQMLNVLCGDMSIVDPRPPIPREVELYTKKQMRRLTVRPGLTCYWQVQPQRNDIVFEK